MRPRLFCVLVTACACLTLQCGGPREKGPVEVLAAASLSDVLTELAERFQENQPEIRVECLFVPSGEAAGQVRAGTPADVIFIADARLMDQLEGERQLLPASRLDFFSNRLVLVAPRESEVRITAASELLAGESAGIAVAGPASPAGEYARGWLDYHGLLEPLASRFTLRQDARTVLAAVERGEAELGFVYATDAARSAEVRVVYVVPDLEHPRILYSSAILRRAPRPRKAAAFLNYVYSPWGLRAFKQRGFLLPAQEEE